MEQRNGNRRIMQILVNIVVDKAYDENISPRTSYEPICQSCIFGLRNENGSMHCELGLGATKAIKVYSCESHEPNRMYPNVPPSQE